MGDTGRDVGVGRRGRAGDTLSTTKKKEPKESVFKSFHSVIRTGDNVRISGRPSDRPNITFTFRLEGKRLNVTAFNRESGARSTVDMPSANATLSRARGDVAGFRELLNKSKSGVSEASFKRIAQELTIEKASK